MSIRKTAAEKNRRARIATPAGDFIAFYSPHGLCRLDFPSRERRRKRAPHGKALPARIQRWHAAASKALCLALAGRPVGRLPPLDLSAGTNFQRRVWEVLRRIARGQTRSYAEVAQVIGRPKTARAVGNACGANPIPVLVPCHRVLAADRGLRGFSAGLRWKLLLLAREGSEVPA